MVNEHIFAALSAAGDAPGFSAGGALAELAEPDVGESVFPQHPPHGVHHPGSRTAVWCSPDQNRYEVERGVQSITVEKKMIDRS